MNQKVGLRDPWGLIPLRCEIVCGHPTIRGMFQSIIQRQIAGKLPFQKHRLRKDTPARLTGYIMHRREWL